MFKVTKDFKTFIHILNIIFVSYMISLKPNPTREVRKISRFIQDMKHILLWNKIQGLDQEGQIGFIGKRCKNYNCYITTNRSLLEDTRYFDAIVFNLQDISKGAHNLPEVRSWTQKFIFYANDSSDNYPVCNSVYDHFFNWTWTYRMNSALHYRFISLYNMDHQELGSHFQKVTELRKLDRMTKQKFVSKSKAAVVFLDKCKTRSKREKYILDLKTQLQKLNLTLDIFGACGPRQCKRKTMTPCFWRLKKDYYFYLAFEDSFSEDYITDAVLYGYDHYAVPIVRGGADYKEYLPPKSYIDATNMSPEDLATQMRSIIKNRQKYYDMFRWMNYYIVKKSKTMDPCKLCASLNKASWLTWHSEIHDFRNWWNPSYRERCRLGFRSLFIL